MIRTEDISKASHESNAPAGSRANTKPEGRLASSTPITVFRGALRGIAALGIAGSLAFIGEGVANASASQGYDTAKPTSNGQEYQDKTYGTNKPVSFDSAKPTPKPSAKPTPKPEPKFNPAPEPKPTPKPEPKPTPKPNR